MEVMWWKSQKKDKGSFTIEASIIFSLIVLTILLLLFTFLYMLQKSNLISAASYTAQQGAELWLDSRRDMESGAVNTAKPVDPIGYRVFDNLFMSGEIFEGSIVEEPDAKGKPKLVLKMNTGNNLTGQKVALVGEALGNKLNSSILKPKSTKVRITFSNNALRGRLEVEIIQEIKVPLGGLKKFFDGKDTLTVRGWAAAAVSEPTEYIRNIDLAVELYKKLDGELDFMDLIDKVKSKGKK